MPYRSAHVEREKRVAEPGIVADMVRQFAEKHAFLRELVQNGIDAGATRIHVCFDRDDTGVVRTSVTDDGAGMSRATIEGPLLTLFSSSKENDRSKIGKYGIGFVSVFALEPEHVEVRTRTADEAWLLRLFGDHSWELAPGDRGAERGTTVTLVQPMPAEAFTAHVAAGTAALKKWCRHARVPIELVILDAGDPAATKTLAIQEDFAAPGLVAVLWTNPEDGEERIVAAAGPVPGEPDSFLGYYNRGLTLFEETIPPGHDVFGGVRVKIDSPKLAHTLSRDGVVKDGRLMLLLNHASELVRGRLWPGLARCLASAALNAPAPAVYVSLLAAAAAPAFGRVREHEHIIVPLVEPIGVQSTCTLAALFAASDDTVLFAAESTPLTRALAALGRPVVRWIETIPHLRAASDERDFAEAEQAIAYAGRAPERHDGDDALEAAVLAVLRTIGRSLRYVQLARFEGAAKTAAYRVTTSRESVVPVADAQKQRWGRNATVQLNVEDAAVRLARRRARTEPVVAAHLLCRALLVADGPLAPDLVDRLLEAALD